MYCALYVTAIVQYHCRDERGLKPFLCEFYTAGIVMYLVSFLIVAAGFEGKIGET